MNKRCLDRPKGSSLCSVHILLPEYTTCPMLHACIYLYAISFSFLVANVLLECELFTWTTSTIQLVVLVDEYEAPGSERCACSSQKVLTPYRFLPIDIGPMEYRRILRQSEYFSHSRLQLFIHINYGSFVWLVDFISPLCRWVRISCDPLVDFYLEWLGFSLLHISCALYTMNQVLVWGCDVNISHQPAKRKPYI